MTYKNLKDTKNFKIPDLICKCGCNGIPDTKEVALQMELLQKTRDHWERPLKVKCGYRCPAHNEAMKGVAGSQHLTGIATDIAIPQEIMAASGELKERWLKNMRSYWHGICREKGLGGGVGFYDTFIHVDSRKMQSDFDYRKEVRGQSINF